MKTFSSVAALRGSTLKGERQLVRTSSYYEESHATIYGEGAGFYLIFTLADYRNEVGDPSWVADDVKDIILANGNIAVFQGELASSPLVLHGQVTDGVKDVYNAPLSNTLDPKVYFVWLGGVRQRPYVDYTIEAPGRIKFVSVPGVGLEIDVWTTTVRLQLIDGVFSQPVEKERQIAPAPINGIQQITFVLPIKNSAIYIHGPLVDDALLFEGSHYAEIGVNTIEMISTVPPGTIVSLCVPTLPGTDDPIQPAPENFVQYFDTVASAQAATIPHLPTGTVVRIAEKLPASYLVMPDTYPPFDLGNKDYLMADGRFLRLYDVSGTNAVLYFDSLVDATQATLPDGAMIRVPSRGDAPYIVEPNSYTPVQLGVQDQAMTSGQYLRQLLGCGQDSRKLGAVFGGTVNITTTAADVAAGLVSGAAVLGGNTNTLKAEFDGDMRGALICGGQENTADGYYVAIVGGKSNVIDADIVNYSFIGGGDDNSITGTQAFLSAVVGGRGNRITGATANRCFIGGGGANIISGDQVSRAVIVGGEGNRIDGLQAYYCFIGGGQNNDISGQASFYSSVVGGLNNRISGAVTNYSFVGGGQDNSIAASSAAHSAIVSGRDGTIANNGQYSVIAGGFQNTINGQRSVVAGGFNNTIASTSGTQNCIGGGANNSISSTTVQHATIAGGENNEIGSAGNGTVIICSAILGGQDAKVLSSHGTTCGGLGLVVSSYMEITKGTYNDSSNPYGGSPSKTAYVANQIAESLGIGADDANRANAYVWLKNGKQIRYNTPVYADNAAALAGGEIVGTVYRTATGQLMEVY